MENPGVEGRIILRWNFRKWDGGGGHGLDLPGSGQGQIVGTLKTRLCTFGFHKMWRISWLTEDRLASQEGLCSMK